LHSDAPYRVVGLGLVLVGVRHQREETCALDCRIQLALIVRLRTRETRRRDLAVFADEVLQRFEVLVVDVIDASGRETAELLALEERILLLTTLVVSSPSIIALILFSKFSCLRNSKVFKKRN
jgi:hypothetical protein